MTTGTVDDETSSATTAVRGDGAGLVSTPEELLGIMDRIEQEVVDGSRLQRFEK